MKLALLLASIMCGYALSSCGANNLSANVDMTLVPNQSYLLPGSGASCSDYYAFSIAGSTTTATVLGTSVNQYRLVYPVFSLTWSSSDLLYVAFIQIDITNPFVSGGSFTYQITSTELESILGVQPGAPFNGTLYPNYASVNPMTINTSSARGTGNYGAVTYFPPCEFTIGGVGLTNPSQGFAGSATVTLVGYSVANDGTQKPVKKQINTQFTYVP